MSKRKKRILLALPVVLLGPALGVPRALNLFDDPGGFDKVRLTISRETTFIDGPVNEDGTINYVAYLNAKYGEGITPENNAAVPLFQALGPEVYPEKLRGSLSAVVQLLGMDPLPTEGEYFVSFETFVHARLAAQASQPATDQVTIAPADPMVQQVQEAAAELGIAIPSVSPAEEAATAEYDSARQRPWTRGAHPLVAEWLDVNEKALTLAAEATTRPRHYFPLVCSADPPVLLEAAGAPIGAERGMGQALAARGMLKLGEGDIPGAWKDVRTTHMLARLMSQSPALISRMVAVAVESAAAEADWALATSGRLTREQAKTFLGDLQAMGPLIEPMKIVDAIDEADRIELLDMMMKVARDYLQAMRQAGGIYQVTKGITANRSYGQLDWDLMLKKCNQWIDRQVQLQRDIQQDSLRSLSSELAEEQRTLARRMDDRRRLGFKAKEVLVAALGSKRMMRNMVSDLMGDFLLCIEAPTFERVRIIQVGCSVKLALAQTAMALAACKADRNGYPSRLSELSPEYLKEIPLDLFSGKDLIYKPTGDGQGYLLYSIGEDGKDDGGQAQERRDFVVQAGPKE